MKRQKPNRCELIAAPTQQEMQLRSPRDAEYVRSLGPRPLLSAAS